MASSIEWFNMALAHLGQDPVADLNFADLSANRVPPRRMMTFMGQALDLLVEDWDWLDMQAPVNVTPLSIGGFTTWTNVYLLPKDFVRMSKVCCSGEWQTGLHYDQDEIPRRVLMANGEVTKAMAIVRPPWDLLSPSLGLAASFKLAWLACVAVTGKDEKRPGLAADYLDTIRDAARAEAWNHAAGEPDLERLGDHRRLAM